MNDWYSLISYVLATPFFLACLRESVQDSVKVSGWNASAKTAYTLAGNKVLMSYSLSLMGVEQTGKPGCVFGFWYKMVAADVYTLGAFFSTQYAWNVNKLR